MNLAVKTLLIIIFWQFFIFSDIFAPRSDIEECAKKISTVFTFDSPLDNFLKAFMSYTEDKFIGDNALPEEAYDYYKELLNMSNFESLPNVPSPQEFCNRIDPQNDYHKIWSLPDYGIYQRADNENACIESLKKIGCYESMSGIDTFKHLYFKGDDEEITLEKIYPNWKTQYGDENINNPEYEDFLRDIFNKKITWIYWYMNDLSNYYRSHSDIGTFIYPTDYCRNLISNKKKNNFVYKTIY